MLEGLDPFPASAPTRESLTPTAGTKSPYSYDGLNRLTRAKETVGLNVTASWSYCYDPNGNRTYDSTSTAATVLCPGQPDGPAPTYTYDATDALIGRAGQPANAFAYDDNGAEVRAVGSTSRTNGTWSPRGQLTGLTANGNAHTYAYAGEGNKERLGFDNRGYQHTAVGLTSQTGIDAATIIREPNGTPVALRTNGNSYYFIADRQGSTIALVAANGSVANSYSYEPFGAERGLVESVNNPFRYIGGSFAEDTGLYHLEARYYDPALGRFTQPDPSGQEANAYVYSENDPCNASDGTGLKTHRVTVKCQVVHYVRGTVTGYVFGFGKGNTREKAVKAAQKDANRHVPKGHYKRHCHVVPKGGLITIGKGGSTYGDWV
ncbi:hypothetical protein DQ239_19490 [Blastococcus sp. TF02-09]|nr:hypothetical protein DQ239_19490 [Blastococcus sp. TF02-9]